MQVPVLVDMHWRGVPAKLMLWANRNGFFYVLDRVDRPVSLGHAVREGELGERARRTRPADADAAAAGQPTWPGNQGGTNWYPPSFSPRTGLFYFSAWEDYATIYRKENSDYKPGATFVGGGFTVLAPVPGAPTVGIGRRGPINNWTDEVGHGAVIAIDPQTGEQQVEVRSSST